MSKGNPANREMSFVSVRGAVVAFVVVAFLLAMYLAYPVMNASSPETIHATTMPVETSDPPHRRSPDPALGAQVDRRITQLQGELAVLRYEFGLFREQLYAYQQQVQQQQATARAQREEEYKQQMEISEAVSHRSPWSAIPLQRPDSVDDTDEGFVATTLKNEMFDSVEQIRDHYSSTYYDNWQERETEIEFLNRFLTKIGKQEEIVDTPEEQ